MPRIDRKTGKENWSHGSRPSTQQLSAKEALEAEVDMLRSMSGLNEAKAHRLMTVITELSVASWERIERDMKG